MTALKTQPAHGAHGSAERPKRARTEQDRDGQALGRARDRDLGAQAVHGQPLAEVREAPGLAVEMERRADPAEEEVVQELALRGEEGGIDGALLPDLADVVGDQIEK